MVYILFNKQKKRVFKKKINLKIVHKKKKVGFKKKSSNKSHKVD
jgi:hypothetical protein